MKVGLSSSSESLLRPGPQGGICLSFHLDLSAPIIQQKFTGTPPCGWTLSPVLYDFGQFSRALGETFLEACV